MFGFLKNLLPVGSGKLWMMLALLAVTAIAVSVVWFSAASLSKELSDANGKLNDVAKNFEETQKDLATIEENLRLLIEARKIDDSVGDQVENTKVIYRDRFDLVDKKVDERVAGIVKKYAELAQTETNAELRDQEISAARLNGLWQTYCANQASAPSCLKKTNQP